MKNNQSSLIIAIEKDIREKKHEVRTSSDTERMKIIEKIEWMYPELPPKERERLRDQRMTLEHLRYIRDGVEKGYSEEQIEQLCSPEYDVWQVKLVCVGFDNGLPMDVILSSIDTTSLQSFEDRENILMSAAREQSATVQTKVTAATHTVMTPKYRRERG